MWISVEMRGVYRRRVFTGPDDQLEGLRTVTQHAGDALLAFCFMSTHLHLLLEHPDAPRIVRQVRRALDATADRRGVARFDEPHIEVLSDGHAAVRYAGYAHENPVKAGMVTHARAWGLSSYRDAVGLRRAPWYSPEKLLALASDSSEPPQWLRGEVATGEPEQLTWPTEPLDLLARSTRSVFGLTEDEWARPRRGAAARHCFVVTAELRGWRRAEIAAFLGWTERHGRRVPFEITPQVRANLTVLADPVLRPTNREWWFVPADGRGPNLWKEWWDCIASGAEAQDAAEAQDDWFSEDWLPPRGM